MADPSIGDELILVQGTSVEAGHLSAMAGTLAALTFASIIFLISNPPRGRNVRDYAPHVFVLFGVFFLLLFATFMYIPVAGSRYHEEQQITFLVAGMVLSIGVTQLFLGMTWTFVSYEFDDVYVSGTKWIFRAILLIVTLNILGTIYNVYQNINVLSEIAYKNINVSLGIGVVTFQETAGMFVFLFATLIFGNLIGRILFSNKDHTTIYDYLRKITLSSVIYSICMCFYFVYLFTFWNAGEGLSSEGNQMMFYWLRYLFIVILGVFFFLFELVLPRKD